MPRTVTDIMHSAQVVLNDLGASRWPVTQLLEWINLGAARICSSKPNANTLPVTLPLIAGAEQALPYGATLLSRVLHGQAGTTKRAVTVVSRRSLDVMVPGWQDTGVVAPTAMPDHVIYDPADPDIFHVYPPNNGGGELRAEFAFIPIPIDAPALPDDISSYTMDIPIGDDFQGALIDYVLYRCFSIDAALPNAAGRAASHFQAFQVAIGEKIQRDLTMNATTAHSLPKT